MSGNQNGNGQQPTKRPQVQITVSGDVDVQLIGRRFSATTKYWKGTRGHAFCPEIGADVYVFFEDIEMEGHRKLDEGQDIEFTLGQDEKGLRAYKVKPLRSYWTHWSKEQWESA